MTNDTKNPLNIPLGFCHCGCGQKTKIATKNHTENGYIKGQPRRFVAGHARRKTDPMWIMDTETGCWVWQRFINPSGYGMIGVVGGKVSLAHRYFYEKFKGPIPEGMPLDHLCRNRACVNPDHVEPVTPTENRRRSPWTKLTIELVRAIRAIPRDIPSHEVAKDFGVSASSIRQIRNGKHWKEDVA